MKISKVETFQLEWGGSAKASRSAFVRIEAEDGAFGLGEASPMEGGLASLVIIAKHMAPLIIGRDALDHAVIIDTLFHKFVKLGPEGAVTGALAALDIALWDLKGKLFGQPVYKLLGGAWRTSLTCYASIGGNAWRTVDEVVKVVERRVAKENPAAVKIRWDGDRTKQDVDIPGDIAKAKAVRKALGDDFVLGLRRQQRVFGRRRHARRTRARGPRLRLVRGAGPALPRRARWAKSRSASTSRSRPASRPIRCRASRT